jgi:hypothetical protein
MNLGGRGAKLVCQGFFPPMTLLFELGNNLTIILWGLLGDFINKCCYKYFNRRVFEGRVMFFLLLNLLKST